MGGESELELAMAIVDTGFGLHRPPFSPYILQFPEIDKLGGTFFFCVPRALATVV
jgi:hypothetical protein